MLHKNILRILLVLIVTTSHYAIADNADEKKIEHIDVFTTTSGVKRLQVARLKQITNLPVIVHYVDAVNNFQAFLGGKHNVGRNVTQKDVEKLKIHVQAKLSSPQIKTEKKKLEAGLKAYQKAKALGINKIPAVVFNDQYVVYGSDVVKATKIYYQKVSK